MKRRFTTVQMTGFAVATLVAPAMGVIGFYSLGNSPWSYALALLVGVFGLLMIWLGGSEGT